MKKLEEALYKHGKLLLSIITSAFAVAIFVCVLCDFILNRALTWSIYPIASCVFTWFSVLPLLMMKKHGAIASMCVLSIGVMPLLLAIEYACPVKGWAISLGLPVTIATLAYLWVVLFVFFKSKLRKWYAASAAALLAAPLTYFINNEVSVFLQEPNMLTTVLNTISLVCLAFIFFSLGVSAKRTKPCT